ncbi:hypothetical protein Clacol_001851 [Clathrus columnatus]|uniref:Carboxylic ester hydrolase n=1 Tax=Clathrus columnatus TaxID=1419009 RepID=A0AAV5A2I2_9AGAM|nr:hypothetical protein Clacol_001851 [Clathrus columnatus]
MVCLKTIISATFAFNAFSVMGVTISTVVTSEISPVASFDPIVDLGYSIYQGTRLANGQNQWLGIRYGAPPIYNNRFRRPQPPSRTSGIQSAKSFGRVCYGQGNDVNDLNMLPVFFWLSGGGYIRKANTNYNGTGLVGWTGNNMLFVSINYRVGPFGFLASQKVRANGNLNAGLYDQRAALEWVQDHITKFGGDPNRVVLVGESAGAGSIALHLITRTDLRGNLFAGIFGLSPFFPSQFFPSDLEWQFNKFAQLAGCGSATDQLACLRSQPGDTLQRANINMAFPGRPGPALTTWSPTIDGDLVPDIPFKLFLEGRFRAVPSIWGVDTDEGTLFAPNASTLSEVQSFLQNNYPRLTNPDLSRILPQYQGLPPRARWAPYFPAGAESYADVTFNCPGLALSSLIARAGAPTWKYRYNVPTIRGITDNTGVYHMAELPLLFGLGNTPLPDPGPAARPIQPVLQTYYTNFVRFLDPNRGLAIPIFWPRWTVQSPLVSPSRLVFQVNNMITEPISYYGVQKGVLKNATLSNVLHFAERTSSKRYNLKLSSSTGSCASGGAKAR